MESEELSINVRTKACKSDKSLQSWKKCVGTLESIFPLYCATDERNLNADIYTCFTWRSSLYGNYIPLLPPPNNVEDVACGLET